MEDHEFHRYAVPTPKLVRGHKNAEQFGILRIAYAEREDRMIAGYAKRPEIRLAETVCGDRPRRGPQTRLRPKHIGWRWRYEPWDLDFFLPDFVVEFDAGSLLIEVKGPTEQMAMTESKIEASGWDGPALVVCAPNRTPELGRILDWIDGRPEWGPAELFRCLSCGLVSVLSADRSWHCRACGFYDGERGRSHVGQYDPAEDWASASNRVQWKSRATSQVCQVLDVSRTIR
jgi:hypothetical protein